MNGAMAEPLVSTIRPPKITIMIMIGSSQNFLRSRMNAHSSTIIEPIVSLLPRSELVLHGLRRRPRGLPLDPVALGAAVHPQAQEILAERPHDEADRRDGHEEQQAEDQRVHDLVEEQAELQPKPVQRPQHLGIGVGDHQEHDRERQGVMPAAMVAIPRQGAYKGKEARENEAKSTIGARLDVLLPREILMQSAGRHECCGRFLLGGLKSLIANAKSIGEQGQLVSLWALGLSL